MVQVNTSTSAFSVTANAVNSTNQVIAGQNSSYYTLLAREWAISPNLVQNTDYSSKYYANLSGTSATTATNAANSILNNAGFIAVSADLTNIDTVATSISNVNAVASNVTNVNTVAGSISNVNAVATDISNVNAVAGDLTNINTVAGDLSNIDINATNINSINNCSTYKNSIYTVANKINVVQIVSDNIADVQTTAAYKNEIDTCSDNILSINGCVAYKDYIYTVADNMSSVLDVWSNLGSINHCSTNMSYIRDVAQDLTNVNAVAGDLTNINTVAANISDVSTCSTNIADINTCAANIPTLSAKVDKAGDTMTGDLNIQKSTYTQYSASYTEGGYLRVKDKNDNIVGNYMVFSNNNKNYIEMSLYDGNSSTAWFGIYKSSASNSDEVSASSGVKQSITNWSFPYITTASYEDITIGASPFEYTTTKDGFLDILITSSADCWCEITYMSGTNEIGKVLIFHDNNYGNPSCFLPVAKGTKLKFTYGSANGGSVTFTLARLIYAIGG